jgi:SUMO ligase MMS21 Smc5/6 complex component
MVKFRFFSQVADALIAKEHNGYAPPQMNPLSDCLQMYNRRIPPEELDYLRLYENYDFSMKSPLLVKPLPPPEFLKLCAIKVKHLVPLRENMMTKLLEKYTTCVEAQLGAYRNRHVQDYVTLSKVMRKKLMI